MVRILNFPCRPRYVNIGHRVAVTAAATGIGDNFLLATDNDNDDDEGHPVYVEMGMVRQR